MGNELRLTYPGALLHVMSRGNERRATFRSDRDRRQYLELLGEAVERFCWILYTYALMPNHVHLFLQLTEDTFSKGMHWLNTNYSIYFNRRYARVGHFFQGRPKTRLVDENNYFLELLRYIALNPVNAKLCTSPESYEWSAHRALIGATTAPTWLATDDALIAFAPQRDVAQRLYKNFVDEGIGKVSSIAQFENQPYVGGKEWMAGVRAKLELRPRLDELTLRQRRVGRPTMDEVITAVAAALRLDETEVRLGRNDPARMLVAWVGLNEGLLRKREIAAALRVSDSSVKRLIDRCDAEMRNDGLLRESREAALLALRTPTQTTKLAL